MAMITCHDCGKEISDKAPACPNCGRPIAQNGNMPAQTPVPAKPPLTQKQINAMKPAYKKVWFWVVIVLAIIVFVSAMNSRGGTEPSGEGTSPAASDTTPTATSAPAANTQSDIIDYTIISSEARVINNALRRTVWETLIEIKNTGDVPIYLGLTKFDLTDNEGNIVKTGSLSSFPDIIYPGESAAFYGNEELTDADTSIEVQFNPRWNITKSRYERVNFDISDVDIREGQFGTTVYGRITNNTGQEQSWAVISALLYDENDTLIGAWMTNVMETMPEGMSLGFEISNVMQRTLKDDVIASNVSRYVVYANTVRYQ
jgi:hypothetical protein